jgi:Rrf2 family protein
VRISAKVDYAVRACCELAARGADTPVPAAVIADAQDIPAKYLKNILAELRGAGIVHTQRGRDGGISLAKPPAAIPLADIIRAVDGPLAAIQGRRPESLTYDGGASNLASLWVAVRASVRSVLEDVSVADVVAGAFPAHVNELLDEPDAWSPH